MTDNSYKHGGCDCHPLTGEHADQPHSAGDAKDCKEQPKNPATPPTWTEPNPCEHKDPCCDCKTVPTSEPDCLENLITAKTVEIAAAEKAKAFKTDLEALLVKAKAAKQEYTQEKHDKLVKLWDEQDKSIEELIRKLVCALPCWYCVIECYVCPYLNKMREAEERLKWDPTLYPAAHNLYDLLSWHTRDKERKERRFNRVKSVLTAWEKPAQTIEKTLTDNAKLIADANKALATDTSKVVFDVFLKLLPLHLAIAPPQSEKWTTRIDSSYTQFCCCDKPDPDDCCGPDVGKTEWSLRQRIIGPQPYLVHPNDYLKIICCLVDTRYGPAQTDFADAEAAVMKVESEIKRNKSLIEEGLKSFDKVARGAIPSVIDCADFKPGDTNQQQSV
ncbi:MAG: hypothetical protein HOP19_25580 [Acidobacteria bacterium]|nr:hypothetical protein [Acidobacteriota bacterium]